jgi:hypothetical protein
MFNQPGAHLARIEAGSAYKSLIGQLPVGDFNKPESRFESNMDESGGHPQISYSEVNQISPSVPIPASVPLPIPTCQTSASSTATSHRLQFTSFHENDVSSSHDDGDAFPTTHECMLLGIPSTSPFSVYSTQSPRSNQQSFTQYSGPTYAPSTSITSQSSFEVAPMDFAPMDFTLQTLLLTPPASRSVVSQISFLVEGARNGNLEQRKQHYTSTSESQTQGIAQDPIADLATWTQGTYNVSDRTSFGSLAPLAAPPTRHRASRSRTRSVATLACENCNKTFASRSERE